MNRSYMFCIYSRRLHLMQRFSIFNQPLKFSGKTIHHVYLLLFVGTNFYRNQFGTLPQNIMIGTISLNIKSNLDR